MSRYDFSAQRLFVDADLREGASVACTPAQANYLRNVLRLKPGDAILVFNGRDGEWRAAIAEAGKREPEAKVVPRDTNRRTRVPKGNPGTVRSQGALQQGSQGDLPESPGASSPPGCRVGTRVPVAPPAPRRGRTARG